MTTSKPGSPDDPLRDFTHLTDLISLYRPKTTSPTPTAGPNLIVLCSWVGAATKHIAKYTDTHRRLFPSATILLIQSTVSGMVMEIDLDPAYDVLVSHLKENRGKTKVLLHAFSNGGARNASLICDAFKDRCCPFDVMVFDSSPGTADLSSTAKAISISLPGWHMLQQVNYIVIYIIAIVFMLVARVLRWEDSISLLRKRLNDSAIVPVSVPRLYLYSKKDELVSARDVHLHAQDARTKGYGVVKEEVFASAKHVALALVEPERYWDAVVELVRSVVKGSS